MQSLLLIFFEEIKISQRKNTNIKTMTIKKTGLIKLQPHRKNKKLRKINIVV